MESGYIFNQQNGQQIIIQLLIEILAGQQAIFKHSLERTSLTENEKEELINDINSDVPVLKETILQQLYVSFGKTPEL